MRVRGLGRVSFPLILLALGSSGCSFYADQNEGVTQFQSSDPRNHGGVDPISLDQDVAIIRVRLFPILSLPMGDPYSTTKNVNSYRLKNLQGLAIYDDKNIVATGESILVDARELTVKVQSSSVPTEVELPLKIYSIVPIIDQTMTAVIWDESDNNQRVELYYRGGFETRTTFFSERNSHLWSLINVLGIEEYLFSVVPSEVPYFWHQEAIKAQAVAARTYAIRQVLLSRKNGQTWDVDPTTMYQSYRGYGRERDSTTVAVQSTQGKLMLYGGKVIEASFSAHSGGVTCAASECFEGVPDQPYLQSRSDDIEMETRTIPIVGTWNACTTKEIVQYQLAKRNFMEALAPDFEFPFVTETCDSDVFNEKVRSHVDPRLQVNSVRTPTMSNTGRVWNLGVELIGGQTLILPRSIVSQQKLPSIRLVLPGRRSHFFRELRIDSNGVYRYQGHGFGHGVGLSQYGAQLRASSYNQSHEQILKFYYTGIDFRNL